MKSPNGLISRSALSSGYEWKRRFKEIFSPESGQMFDFSPLNDFCIRKLERYKRQTLWDT